jgi:glycosyltransferase involved in cell wall biosynthesis
LLKGWFRRLKDSESRHIEVTIGVCVCNSASTIHDAIESIMAQDYPHKLMEVIFVDDGSADETLLIIKKFASKMDIKVKISHHDWKGLGPSRNVVVNNASGKYIVWVDGDMRLSRNFVRKQVEFMERHQKVAVARGKFMGLPSNSLVAVLENMEWKAIAHRAKKITNLKLCLCGGTIQRVDALREVGGFDNTIRGAGEDEDLEYRLERAGWLVMDGADVIFYERRKDTWKALWNQYFWYGYSRRYLMDKKRSIITFPSLYRQFTYSKIAYRLTNNKLAFLLPLEYCFKALASFAGIIKAIIR